MVNKDFQSRIELRTTNKHNSKENSWAKYFYSNKNKASLPVSDGLDTRPCKILDPPLSLYTLHIARSDYDI